MVVDLPSDVELESIVPRDYTATVFGGVTARTTTTSLDIWGLRDTYLIRSLGLEPSFQMLPSTTVFTINSICFHPAQLCSRSAVYESGFLAAIGKESVEFQSSRVPLPHVHLPLHPTDAVQYPSRSIGGTPWACPSPRRQGCQTSPGGWHLARETGARRLLVRRVAAWRERSSAFGGWPGR